VEEIPAGRPTGLKAMLRTDAVPGITNGVANIPDAMANALLAGVSPVAGLYALLVGTPAAALTTSSTYMTVAVTAAMAVTVGAGLEGVPADQRGAALSTMSLLVGAVMVLFGLLRGGRMLRFVSNAVMKGFLNGVALLVIIGQLGNVTGFEAGRPTKLARALETVLNVREWRLSVVLITVATVLLIVVLDRSALKQFSMLIALTAVSVGVAVFDVAVPLVGDVSSIPKGLPMPSMPDLALAVGLLVPAASVALIGLVQGGGISKAYPNPDGTYPDSSRDMIGQGVGNAAAALVGGVPVGASVSSTALLAGSSARTRMANILIGAVVAVALLLLGPLVEQVPLSVLGAILLVVGVSAIDLPGMLDVWHASRESAVIMGITLVTMLLVPVQYAVLTGAALSAVQYVYNSSKDVRVVELRSMGDGRWMEASPPAVLPSNTTTVVDIYGSVFYAGVDLVDTLLPCVGDAERPVLIVRLRGRSEIGSTALEMLRRYRRDIAAADGRLILAGVEETLIARLQATGFVAEIGEENVFPKSDIVYGSVEAACELGDSWLAERSAEEQ